MDEALPPVIEVSGRFGDPELPKRAAAALNRWFRWIVEGGGGPPPDAFEEFGVSTKDWAWQLGEDVDWDVGPHARAVGDEVRIALRTRDTHARIAGLLRTLGARTARVTRDA